MPRVPAATATQSGELQDLGSVRTETAPPPSPREEEQRRALGVGAALCDRVLFGPAAAAGASDATAVPPGGAGGSELDPETTSMLNLFCCWSYGFLTAIEGTVSVPSMWLYVQSLGGGHSEYGLAIASFAFFRLAAMGVFGMWVDARTYKEVYVVSLLVAMSGGLIYAAAPTLGLWAIVAGRSIMGAMSACSVATQAFVSTNTSLADRTKYMSINTLVSNVLTLAGPVFNLFLVLLPEFDLRIGRYIWVFNSYTWVGYFLFCGQWAVLTFILCCFHEPPRKARRKPPPLTPCGSEVVGSVATVGGLFPWGRVWTDSWLHKTGCWMIFLCNFRNNCE